jgi:hypothetical protein
MLLNKEVPITTQKLNRLGISSSLARKYKESGWIESIGVGAFKFPDAPITLEGTLHALQIDMSLDLHAGAKTALEMAGIRQYYRERERVYMFSDSKTTLPSWVRHLQWGKDIHFIKSSKWKGKQLLFNPNTKEFDFFIATRELAIVQQIELIGRGESFDETAQLFEILDSLNPELINEILVKASFKAKRIFFFFFDLFDPPWKKEVDPGILNSGHSIITVEKGGKYLKNYNLVIPRGFHV